VTERYTNEASSNKKIKWYTQQFLDRVVERSRSQSLAADIGVASGGGQRGHAPLKFLE